MFITIMTPAMSENEEPPNEFTEMQQAQDRASWIGIGCNRPFAKDAQASFRNEQEKK